MATDRKPNPADIGALLTLRDNRGVLFYGIVAGFSETGTYQITRRVNWGPRWGWESVEPPESRFVRGAEVVE